MSVILKANMPNMISFKLLKCESIVRFSSLYIILDISCFWTDCEKKTWILKRLTWVLCIT